MLITFDQLRRTEQRGPLEPIDNIQNNALFRVNGFIALRSGPTGVQNMIVDYDSSPGLYGLIVPERASKGEKTL